MTGPLRHVRRMRGLGAVLGLASGPSAGFGQAWAQTGDGRLHVWLIASAVAAVLGAVMLPVFYPERVGEEGGEPLVIEGPGAGFSALFGLSVGLVAGAFAAFPMGAVTGGFGGALGAAISGLSWRRLGLWPAALVGPVAGLCAVWVWTGGLS